MSGGIALARSHERAGDQRSERQLETGEARPGRAPGERAGRCLRGRDCRSCGRLSPVDRETQATTLALQRDGGLSRKQLQVHARR